MKPKNMPNTIRRMKRPDLPPNQQVYMGPPISPVATPAASTSDKEAALHKQLAEAKRKLQEAQAPDPRLDSLSRDVTVLKTELESTNGKLAAALAAQQQAEAALAEAKAAAENQVAPEPAPPSDKVWVTAIESRTSDNGTVLVNCTMHYGDEDAALEGVIHIPATEIPKLKPPRSVDA